jgi:hypothetical protein
MRFTVKYYNIPFLTNRIPVIKTPQPPDYTEKKRPGPHTGTGRAPSVFPLFSCFFLITAAAFGQNLVQDSLEVAFGPMAAGDTAAAVVAEIIDQRDESPDIIGRTETNRYGWIPVDLAVRLGGPLTGEIRNLFPRMSGPEDGPALTLVVREFELNRSDDSFFHPRYRLTASFSVLRKDGSGPPLPAGQLYYETVSRKPLFGDRLRDGYEAVLAKWRDGFIRDVGRLSAAGAASMNRAPNFRAGTVAVKPLFLMIGADAAFSAGVRTVDAQVFFSPREAARTFMRSGGTNVRYRDEREFESIEFGVSKDYLFRRIHPKILLRGKSVFLFGVNRWKDFRSVPRTLMDAVIFDGSVSQAVLFDPLDGRSIVLGAGVQENLDYLYHRDWRFRLAFLIHAGVKL